MGLRHLLQPPQERHPLGARRSPVSRLGNGPRVRDRPPATHRVAAADVQRHRQIQAGDDILERIHLHLRLARPPQYRCGSFVCGTLRRRGEILARGEVHQHPQGRARLPCPIRRLPLVPITLADQRHAQPQPSGRTHLDDEAGQADGQGKDPSASRDACAAGADQAAFPLQFH